MGEGALRLRAVVKRYSAGDQAICAVDRLSLTVEDGELVAVYGPSGSGKTSTLLLASAILDPDEGVVDFRGQELNDLGEIQAASYRRKVGFIFQGFHLMGNSTALDNVIVKLASDGFRVGEARRKAWPWLERMGLTERAMSTADRLSMGERQRVAIARALVNDPQLILADEPTANLDSDRTATVFEMLRDVCHDRKIPGLLVTHDPSALAIVDRAYTLRDGRAYNLDTQVMSR